MARRSRRSRRTPATTAGENANIIPGAVTYGGGSGYSAVDASTMRGYIYWPTMDTRREATPHTRLEICRRARALCENMGIAGHLIECMADLVGYLQPMAATRDTEWNQLANDNFIDKQSVPDVYDAAGKFNFYEHQLKLDEAAFRDGDVLAVLTETTGGTARVATYESHQIGNPYGEPAEVDGWNDGVRTNRFGRHLAYSILDPVDRTRAAVIGANDCIFYGHFKKHGNVRPVSILRAAINHLLDIGEIVRDVKYGIKVRNQIPLTVESQLGSSFGSGATQAIASNIRTRSIPGHDGQGNSATTDLSYEEIMQGGNIPRLPPGMSLKALIDAAPHPNQLALIDYLIRDICWSAGLAPEIVWNIEKLRGANNRLLNSKLQRWIGSRLLHKRAFVRRFWVYHVAKEMKAGRLRECRDPEWWKVAMLPQESITADKGREGKLNIDLVVNRLMSLRDFFALSGKHWLDELRQMAQEDQALSDLGLAIGDVARARPADPAIVDEEDQLDPEDPAAGDEDENDESDDQEPPPPPNNPARRRR